MELSVRSYHYLLSWIPIAIGLGIIGFRFFPGTESLAILLCLSYPAAWVIGAHSSSIKRRIFLIGMCLICLGYQVTFLRHHNTASPTLTAPLYDVEVDAQLMDEPSSLTAPLRLAVIEIETVESQRMPKYIRAYLKNQTEPLHQGDKIRFTATLQPPHKPFIPGGFNFAEYAHYQQLGAMAFVDDPVEILSRQATINPFTAIRTQLYARFSQSLPPTHASIAYALIVGDISHIDKGLMDKIRTIGLAHLMAISGMNMVIVGIGVYLITRRLLCLLPSPLSTWSKPLGAILGIACSGFYVMLVGMPISAVRAYIMIALCFTAALINRYTHGTSAITTACCIILLVWPESLWNVGFQMSFAATLALVRTYEVLASKHHTAKKTASRNIYSTISYTLRVSLRYLAELITSTAIASLAALPFTLYHFHQISPYSLIANLLIGPLVSLWIIPSLLIGSLLPLQWPSALVLQLADHAIALTLNLIEHIAAWPLHMRTLPIMPTASFIVCIIGGLWLMLGLQRYRWFCCFPFIIGLIIWNIMPQPDFLFGEPSSRGFGFIDHESQTLYLRGNPSAFITDIWKEALSTPATLPLNDTMILHHLDGTCHESLCTYHTKGWSIAVLEYTKDKKKISCPDTDIVVNYSYRNLYCRDYQLLISRDDLVKHGTHSLTINKKGVALDYAF